MEFSKNATPTAGISQSVSIDEAHRYNMMMMDHRAFRDEASVLFMAGHETTANTLAWAWFLLSQDAETERRVQLLVDNQACS